MHSASVALGGEVALAAQPGDERACRAGCQSEVAQQSHEYRTGQLVTAGDAEHERQQACRSASPDQSVSHSSFYFLAHVRKL
jgi:hypothetical protein